MRGGGAPPLIPGEDRLEMLDWRIFYSDGSTYSSEEGLPQTAPPRGVEVIAQRSPRVGKHLVTRCDFYWWGSVDGTLPEWKGSDLAGFYDFLMALGIVRPGNTIHQLLIEGEWTDVDLLGLIHGIVKLGIVKLGRTIDSDSYDRFIRAALADLDTGKKSAYRLDEQRAPSWDKQS